ncbi:hypothetical protein C8D77_112104 [Mesorhizobium loti]|uniref:Tyr recombinase domain-containing protein n=1 Tax=Rhizobium loti TaxID=381 RepID=A0A8E2W826_RHILI|nr:hypothetical protein C8D77_112104 [Mesorhizobium loti]
MAPTGSIFAPGACVSRLIRCCRVRKLSASTSRPWPRGRTGTTSRCRPSSAACVADLELFTTRSTARPEGPAYRHQCSPASATNTPPRPVKGKPSCARIFAVLGTLDRGTLRGLRDRAMLLLGFAGALRRSEIVDLDVARDQTEDGRGWINFSGQGRAGYVAGQDRLARGRNWSRLVRRHLPGRRPVGLVEACPYCAWPLFRGVTGQGKVLGADRLNGQQVARLVKRAALPPVCAGSFRARPKVFWPSAARRPRVLGGS